MPVVSVPAALRTRIGDEASEGLAEMFTSAGDKSEVRLTQEICGLRVEMHQGFADIRREIAQSRVEILKWMIVLWVGNLSAMVGLLALMLRSR
jgi:hypothetical protein